MLLQKNPELSFAIEQSFPLKSTYADATPLGPIMELRVQDSQNVFTAERAAQSVDYWRTTAQQLLADPEAAGSLETRMAYAKMAFEQASLLLDHHYSAEAEQSFRLANEICPSSSEAAFRLSDLLTRSGRANEAAELLEDFARRNPEKRAAVEEFRQSHPGRDETAPKPPSIP
jgi:tetratricopeptide (TPR) repeat protein